MKAAPAEAGPAAEKKKSLLRRIPTPLIVTLVGIALTAWLLPAFTRQWDDRQKAHEVKAGIVSDIATATAPALFGGEAIWSGRPVSSAQRQKLGDGWALAALQIEAKIRTYFSVKALSDWQIYAWAVDRFVGANHLSVDQGLANAAPPVGVPVAFQLALITDSRNRHAATPMPNYRSEKLDTLLDLLGDETRIENWRDYSAGTMKQSWQQIESEVLALQQAVTDQVIKSHTSGYSTSTHDLIHDLIP